MRAKIFISFIVLLSFSITSECQWSGPSVNFSKGPLTVSENGRLLLHENGDPFFYLGDTAWELFHRLSREETETYLENRRSKGFTVIQAVALAELDGINAANYYGDKPFIDNNLTKPNEKYFEHLDWVIKKAGEKGIYIGLLPTWGDKVDKQWGTGPAIFNSKNIAEYGKWIALRYRDFPNIIWINGGDRLGGGANLEIWNALGKAIKSIDKKHLMTFHPMGGHSSSEWFHNEDWLDFNMMQTGHSDRFIPNYKRISTDRKLDPAKPTLDGEPCYEDHAINWNPDFGWFDDADIRCLAYWGLLSGSCGTTYGAHPIWQFYSEGKVPITHARHNWYDVLDLPGSGQMLFLRQLFESRDWKNISPSPEILVHNNQDESIAILAAKSKDFALIYSPQTNSIKLDHTILFGKNFKASWFNPRNGIITSIDTTKMKDLSIFVPQVRGIDWVLVIEKIVPQES